jgi:small subunit ribosomal protein S9
MEEHTVTDIIMEGAATGRRKTAVAHVRLAQGSGKVVVNGHPFDRYFPTDALRRYIQQPLEAVGAADKYDVTAELSGGGLAGQAGALRHGISRSLAQTDVARRATLKAGGFLTRDARMKERKKSGQPGARKRFQFSKR